MLRGMVNSICSAPPPSLSILHSPVGQGCVALSTPSPPPIKPTVCWDGFTGGVPPSPGQGGAIFQQNIRDKMRYSNLSDNMIISEL